MTRSNRMNTIVGLSENQKDAAARQLAQSKQLLDQSETQLADMKRCRVEYAAQLSTQSSQTRTAAELQGIRIFIQQLDVAIGQLEEQTQERTSVSELHQDQWLKLRNKTQALSDIKDRYASEEQKSRDQKEQFEMDELSQRKGD